MEDIFGARGHVICTFKVQHTKEEDCTCNHTMTKQVNIISDMKPLDIIFRFVSHHPMLHVPVLVSWHTFSGTKIRDFWTSNVVRLNSRNFLQTHVTLLDVFVV